MFNKILVAKLVAFALTRDEAIGIMKRCLDEFKLKGV